ncbi:MAG: hypothetical protein Q8N74_03480 [Sulfuricella sp.]|nr:hypothetical protein [Sulfuricella sp.]
MLPAQAGFSRSTSPSARETVFWSNESTCCVRRGIYPVDWGGGMADLVVGE